MLPSAPPRIIASAITSPFACSRVIQKATAAATSPVTATSVQRVVSVQLANIDSEIPQFSAQVRLKKPVISICPLGSSDKGTVTTHLVTWSRMKASAREDQAEAQMGRTFAAHAAVNTVSQRLHKLPSSVTSGRWRQQRPHLWFSVRVTSTIADVRNCIVGRTRLHIAPIR